MTNFTGEVVYQEEYAHLANVRSAEYLAGARYILQRKYDGTAQRECPYPTPSAQADAWMAGCQAALESYRYNQANKRWQA